MADDRSTEWPTDHRRSNVTACEKVTLEGETKPSIVKAIFMVARRPGLTVQEFQEHWVGEHGRVMSNVPGLRRYVQNHELWFGGLAIARERS